MSELSCSETIYDSISDGISMHHQLYYKQTIGIIEMGLKPVPLQLDHVATNRSRNHHSTHLMGVMVVATSVCSDML